MEKEGLKFDDGKLRFDLLPPEAIKEVVKIYSFGAKKYGDRNWEKGIRFSRIFAAIQRHLWTFWEGEDIDKESGCLHLAHAAWGCLALIHFCFFNQEMDDRTKKQKEVEDGE